MIVSGRSVLRKFLKDVIKLTNVRDLGFQGKHQSNGFSYKAFQYRMKYHLLNNGVSEGPSKFVRFVNKRRIYKWHRLQPLPGLNFIKSVKWTRIPLGIGVIYIAIHHYQTIHQQEEISEYSLEFKKNFELSIYRLIPLRTISRIWGWINNIDLPLWARKPILNLYASTFECNLEEAEIDDLIQYKNLGEFFRRNLKTTARSIHPGECIISPADGIVMTCGLVNKCYIEQVKGVAYTLDSFLGNNVWSSTHLSEEVSKSAYHKRLLKNPKENDLYYYVVYLAPGDYHRFHSPVNWEINFRRHFTGDLLSVNPGIAKWIPGLFTLNERALYVGQWKHGFFSMTLVGATNVGSIKIYKDQGLQTNCMKLRKGDCRHRFFYNHKSQGIEVKKGEPFGEFNLGSTVVLIFEAPKNYQFKIQSGQRIQVGQALNMCVEHEEKLYSTTLHKSISHGT